MAAVTVDVERLGAMLKYCLDKLKLEPDQQ
jgi:hypothetical protein